MSVLPFNYRYFDIRGDLVSLADLYMVEYEGLTTDELRQAIENIQYGAMTGTLGHTERFQRFAAILRVVRARASVLHVLGAELLVEFEKARSEQQVRGLHVNPTQG